MSFMVCTVTYKEGAVNILGVPTLPCSAWVSLDHFCSVCAPLPFCVFSLSISETHVSFSEDHSGATRVPLSTSSESCKGLTGTSLRAALANNWWGQTVKAQPRVLSQDELRGVTYPPQFLGSIRRKLPSVKTACDHPLIWLVPLLCPITHLLPSLFLEHNFSKALAHAPLSQGLSASGGPSLRC